MSEDIPSLKRIVEPRSLKPAPDVVVGYKKVRPMSKWVFLVISMTMVIVGFALLTNPPMSSSSTHITRTLEPGEYIYWNVHLEKGEQFIISGTVRGGNNDVWIYVKEYGQKVKDFGKVKSPVHVVFTAPEEANYTIYVSNEMSVVTSKSLDLTVIHMYHDYGWAGFFLITGISWLIISILELAKGVKHLVIRVGNEVYDFWLTWRGLVVAVNGVKLDSRLKPGDKFRIGPNDEHVLEIRKVGRIFKKFSFFIDGREVGRLP